MIKRSLALLLSVAQVGRFHSYSPKARAARVGVVDTEELARRSGKFKRTWSGAKKGKKTGGKK